MLKADKILKNLAVGFLKLVPLRQISHFVSPLIYINTFHNGGRGITTNEAHFLYLITKMLKPKIVLETGTHNGYSTSFIGYGLMENGSGHCYTFEKNSSYCEKANANFRRLGLANRITLYEGDSNVYINKFFVEKNISDDLDLVFLDSGTHSTVDEFEMLQSRIRKGSGYLICHDVFFPEESGKGVILYPYLRDKYSETWDICVFRTGGPGFVIARKRGSNDVDSYKSLDSYNIKDMDDYLKNWMHKIVGRGHSS